MKKHILGIGRPGLIGAEGDLGPTMEAYKKAGADFVRLFVYTTIRQIFPYRVKEWRDKHNPVFEDEWDEEWWGELRNICDLLAKYDIKAVVTLVDDCNIRYVNMVDKFKQGLQWWRQLWGITDFYSDKMRGHFADFLEPLFSTLKSSHVDYELELVNELYFPNQADTSDHRFQWFLWLSCYLWKKYGIGQDRLWFSGGPNWIPFEHFFSYYCPHQVVTPDNWHFFFPPSPSTKIILSGDGGNGRDIAHGSPFGYHVISVNDAIAIAKKMKERGYYGYEYWNQLSNKNDVKPYLEPLKAMADILEEEDTPPLPPEPTPEPAPTPKKRTWLQQLIHWIFGENSWWSKWQ
jgi:hypothetical protein